MQGISHNFEFDSSMVGSQHGHINMLTCYEMYVGKYYEWNCSQSEQYQYNISEISGTLFIIQLSHVQTQVCLLFLFQTTVSVLVALEVEKNDKR